MDCQGSELKDLETPAVNRTAWRNKVATMTLYHCTHWVHYEHDDDLTDNTSRQNKINVYKTGQQIKNTQDCVVATACQRNNTTL